MTLNFRRRALLIGINYGAHSLGVPSQVWRPLDGPHINVKDMNEHLTRYGYIITTMTDGLDSAPYLLPTRENILTQLRDLVKDVNPGDRIFFQFAGHSHTTQGPNSIQERDRRDEAIVPLGTSDEAPVEELILDDELHKILVQNLPAGAQLIAVLDTCHSATLLDLRHRKCNCATYGVLGPPTRQNSHSSSEVSESNALHQILGTPVSVFPKLNSAAVHLSNRHLFHQERAFGPNQPSRNATDPLLHHRRRSIDSTALLARRMQSTEVSTSIGNDAVEVNPLHGSPEAFEREAYFTDGVRKNVHPPENELTSPGPVRQVRSRRRSSSGHRQPQHYTSITRRVQETVAQETSYIESATSPVLLGVLAPHNMLLRGPPPAINTQTDLSRKRKLTESSVSMRADFDGYNECGGPPHCRGSDTARANVICFSACKDSENSAEYNDVSITRMFINAFDGDPAPSVKRVISNMISGYEELRKTCQNFLEQRKEVLDDEYKRQLVQRIEDFVTLCQHPQVSSQKSLPLEAKIYL